MKDMSRRAVKVAKKWMLIWNDVAHPPGPAKPRPSHINKRTYRGLLPSLILLHKVPIDTILFDPIAILERMSMATSHAFILSMGAIPIHALYGEISRSVHPRMI